MYVSAPPTPTPYMLEAHVQKPALLEIKMSICKWTDGFAQVQRHMLGRISGEGGTAGGGGLVEFEKASPGDSDSLPPCPHRAALL